MKEHKVRKGRPNSSCNIRVAPEFRDALDIEKLGHALIAVALKIAEKKELEADAAEADEDTQDSLSANTPPQGEEGDDMT